MCVCVCVFVRVLVLSVLFYAGSTYTKRESYRVRKVCLECSARRCSKNCALNATTEVPSIHNFPECFEVACRANHCRQRTTSPRQVILNRFSKILCQVLGEAPYTQGLQSQSVTDGGLQGRS